MTLPYFSHNSIRVRGCLVGVLLGVVLGFAVPMSAEAQERGAQEAALLPPDIDGTRPQMTGPLPRILTAADVETYREIFAVQRHGDWKTADRLTGRLKNRILLGHVQAQRYLHPTDYRTPWPELRDWLAEYADHPDANRLHRLARKRKPEAAKAPQRPVRGYLGGSGADAVRDVRFYVSPRQRSKAERNAVKSVTRKIRQLIGKGWPSGALRELDSGRARELLDPVEFAEQRARIAKAYFVFGKDQEALRLAARSAREAGDQVPLAHWAAGLAAWRLGEVADAERHFGNLTLTERASRADRSAGAYWAARAALRLRKPAESTRWLARAAQYPMTFYGLLARQALGLEIPFDWSLPAVSQAKMAALFEHEGARRALALMQVGQSARAEREWRKLFPRLDASLREPLMTIAAGHNMPGLSIRLGGIIRVSTGRTYHAALYPVPSWAPDEGFVVDRALIYAIVRQESGFDTRARSSRGARGLMQLMPRTANYMDKADALADRHALYNPGLNLQLGQRYVDHLLAMERVDGDLFRLLVAYNAGPGNLRKWQRSVDYADDPLLFIESIPSWETREFIEKVLSNMWIYRHRLGQTAPTLDRVASGDWAVYRSIDDVTGFEIRNARYR